MDRYIKADSIGEAWLLALKTVIKYGHELPDDKGSIIETIPLLIEILNPTYPDQTIDALGDKSMLEYLLKNFEDPLAVDDWGYSYAQRLYSFNGENQIQRVVEILKNNAASKSATISLLNFEHDKKHTPCLVGLDFKIRDENLIITGTFRSQDIGKKMYGDALALLKIGEQMIPNLPAKKITLIHAISSAHIYTADLQRVKDILAIEDSVKET